jgi:hypothetical protein
VSPNAKLVSGQILFSKHVNHASQDVEPALVQTLLPAQSHLKDTGSTLQPQPANNVMPDVLLALTLQHALLARESSKKMQLKAVFATVPRGTELSVMEAASHVHLIVRHAPTQTPALPATHLSNFKRRQREQFVLTVHQTV